MKARITPGMTYDEVIRRLIQRADGLRKAVILLALGEIALALAVILR